MFPGACLQQGNQLEVLSTDTSVLLQCLMKSHLLGALWQGQTPRMQPMASHRQIRPRQVSLLVVLSRLSSVLFCDQEKKRSYVAHFFSSMAAKTINLE